MDGGKHIPLEVCASIVFRKYISGSYSTINLRASNVVKCKKQTPLGGGGESWGSLHSVYPRQRELCLEADKWQQRRKTIGVVACKGER